MYIVIARCEDEPFVETYEHKDDLENELLNGFGDGYKFLDKVPDDQDITSFPAMSAVIIKGKIIKPKIVTTVTGYEVE